MVRNGTKTLTVLTLVNEETRECYDVLKKKINVVARAGFNGDFEIAGDSSISRCHAELFYEKKIVKNQAKLFLKLVDKKSKFGTFHNDGIALNERIDSERPIVLSLGDRIRFGVLNSFWIVTEYPFLVCPSTLKKSEKEVLTNAVTKLGGTITREWTDQCTHLCMNLINVTEKVLLCLASAKSIVPIKYFIDLYEALLPDSTTELPFCTDYVPNLIETLLNPSSVSMDVNNDRKTLFSGKTFVCSSMDQYNRISKIIKIAGGETKNYCEVNLSQDEIAQSEIHIVIQQDPSNSENSKEYQQLLEKLKLMNKTPISENDIGLAVIFASTAKHCNPNYTNSLINLQTQSNRTESHTSRVLAPETEVLVVEDSAQFSVKVVPDSHPHTQPCSKRPLDVIMDSEEIMMPKKRGLYSKDIENSSTALKTRAEENVQPTSYESLLIPSSNNHNISHYTNTVVNDESIKSDSCVTHVQSSQNSSNNNDYSYLLQASVANKSVRNTNSSHSETIRSTSSLQASIATESVRNTNSSHSETVRGTSSLQASIANESVRNTNSSHSETVQNTSLLQASIANESVRNTNSSHSETVQNRASTKRKISNVGSTSNNEDDDPFNYKDIDEIDEQITKKPKTKPPLSSFYSILEKSFSKETKPPKSIEPKVNSTVDPNFIMDLLSSAKGTGKCIDTSNLDDKSSTKTYEDDYLLNSVIVETVNMVVSKTKKTENNMYQGSNSNLKNFKKFKRKAKAMQIPDIVPMHLI